MAPHGHGHGSKPIRRRMRMITSCLECRRRKLKCNKSQPCTNCIKFSRECLYLGPKLDEASQLRLTEIKEKVGSLERQLERDVAKGSTSTGNHHRQQPNAADEVEDDLDPEGDLEITPMVALDLTYEDDADGTIPTDELIDLGIQVGRMRITERIGGLNRPRISEEIQAGLGQGPSSSPMFNIPLPPSNGSVPSSSSSDFEIPEFLRPGASYIPPTSGFFFGQVSSPSLLHFLPNQATGDKLMMRYFEAVHPIARCVHRPSFEPVYASFWDDVNQGFEPRASVQALVFAAWFSAAVSLADDNEAAQVTSLAGSGLFFSRSQLVENMKVGTEAALSKANFLRTTRVETMQAFVMYLLPLCRDEVSRAHSVLVGAAVRMAECMGLHRDGQAYGLNPLETHVRRLIWHQLCFLDIRTCEAQGPKPGIRRDDYDTRLPLNFEEEELTNLGWSSVPPSGGPEKWTSNLLSIIRFEINEMMRSIWSDRRKIETSQGRRTNLAHVLFKIEKFRREMHGKYGHLLDDNVPIQLYTKLVMSLLICRLHCMVLHPYHANTSNPMPERLTHVLLVSGITVIESSMHLESYPLFNKQWGWYTGAYQQFQIALLLATEIYYRPDGAANGCSGANGTGNGNDNVGSSQIVDRIWGCLDYVFNLDASMDRSQKSYLILSEIMGKTGVYMSMRKMRAPVAISKAIPEREAVKGSSSAGSPGHQQQDIHMGQGQDGSPNPGSSSSSTSGGSTIHADNPNLKHFGQAHASAQAPQGLGPNMNPAMNPMMMMMMPPSGGLGLGGHQGPFSEMVFAGVSNGEVLYGLPPGSHHQHHHNSSSNGNNPGSPNSSDGGGSVAGHVNGLSLSPHGNGNMNGNGNAMKDIDWEAINMLFPVDPQTGDFNFNVFVPDPNLQAGLMHHHQTQGPQQSQPSQGQHGQNQQQHQRQQQQTPSTSAGTSSSPTCTSAGGVTSTKNGSRAGSGVGKWAR
ncbi:hypothetical protein QBC37DRAFT_271125 [Rhypophila decipiens]|uniref:Zn(2)-C6 fungal-type domain-containing protein n=1 Tax=Rhypophila decipiens TaxID=261697 RepID=A0AAN7BDU3_9PEZI|nr:hypothetical protein QBC37DRAFT_271125 [Rhypophila decipiens]